LLPHAFASCLLLSLAAWCFRAPLVTFVVGARALCSHPLPPPARCLSCFPPQFALCVLAPRSGSSACRLTVLSTCVHSTPRCAGSCTREHGKTCTSTASSSFVWAARTLGPFPSLPTYSSIPLLPFHLHLYPSTLPAKPATLDLDALQTPIKPYISTLCVPEIRCVRYVVCQP
jgi:hypothetical protein